MSTEQSNLVTAKSILSTLGSIAAAAMVARSITNDLLPHEFTDSLSSTIRSFFGKFSSDLTMVIDEFDGLESNQIYEAVELYLGSNSKSFLSATGAAPHRLKVSKLATEKSIQITVDRDEEMVDLFNGVKFRWILVCSQIESKHFYNPRDMNATLRSEVRAFHLNFHKKHKSIVIDQYLPYVIEMANSLKQEIKTIKIHTVDYQNMYGNMADAWPGVNLNHPAQFETLAMDSDLKEMIMADLKRFVRRREYYRRVGKAWKRGYLLYGPPGTGKSSLIAAMANYLNFDIYDLELTGLRCNSELRRLLVATANRSILVVEDIDCSIELTNREAKGGSSSPPPPPPETRQEKQVTLSGFLNFIDGLWSSCGDERIIIFTTNHKDKLDPALLRPGRMDVHIHMSYCTPSGFKVLAQNYLGIIEHVLFEEIEKLIEEVKVTPAEVAEQLMKHDDSEPVLSGLIEFLNSMKCQSEEVKVENEDNEDQKEKMESDK